MEGLLRTGLLVDGLASTEPVARRAQRVLCHTVRALAHEPVRVRGWSPPSFIPWFSRSSAPVSGPYGTDGGATRRFVACSNAYANAMSRGSLHAVPVKLTPYGAGCALKPSGNGGIGAFDTTPNGTMTV